jgi:FkbM family methyltransferase
VTATTDADPAVVYDEQHDVFVRPDTHDLKSALEVRSIVRLLDPHPGDVVLDVGGHIGALSRLCLKAGARVIAVEPEPGNLAVLRLNVGRLTKEMVGPPGGIPSAEVVQGALTDDPALLANGSVPLYLRGKTHTGLHTLVPTPRPNGTVIVPVFSFTAALWHYLPTILKVDIEGGEWSCQWENLPTCVRALHLEMHMIPPQAHGRERAPVVHRILLNQGFECIKEPNFNTMWGTHPVYRR